MTDAEIMSVFERVVSEMDCPIKGVDYKAVTKETASRLSLSYDVVKEAVIRDAVKLGAG